MVPAVDQVQLSPYTAQLAGLQDQTPASVTPKLLNLLAERERDLAEGSIVIVEERRYRLRHLPIEPR